MIKVLGSAQMQACDRAAVEEYRIPGALLMENAGVQVLDALYELGGGAAPLSTAVVCGRGNNGGDGFVVARQLHNLGHEAVVYLLGPADDLGGDARLNYEIATAFGVPVVPLAEDELDSLEATLARFEWIVDGLLGTGIRGAAREDAAAVIRAVNAAGTPVLAIDLPSGLQADRGAVEGDAVRATATVCLAALKPCHVLAPATEYCGEISVAEISIPAPLIEQADAVLQLIEPADVLAALPERAVDSHKGTHGRVLIVGGAPGTAGAAALAARGALRGGAGLVDVACPDSVYDVVGAAAPEALVHPLPTDENGLLTAGTDVLAPLVEQATAVVVGPGLGTAERAGEIARYLVAEASVPLVLDADGLNVLGEDLSALRAARGARVLTPHPGEAARLLGCSPAEVQADRPAALARLVEASGAVVVLKGFRTLIGAPGAPVVVNPTGNPGMATGGTGDVLAGLIGALLAQQVDPWRAAWVAAWLHGAAGDRTAVDGAEMALTAGDVAEALPAAFAELAEAS